MINFDAVDFSGRRSEEVISFFWRSVYNEKGTFCDTFDHNFKNIHVLYNELGIIRKALARIIRWWPYFEIFKNGA